MSQKISGLGLVLADNFKDILYVRLGSRSPLSLRTDRRGGDHQHGEIGFRFMSFLVADIGSIDRELFQIKIR